MITTIYVKDICQYAMFDADGMLLRTKMLEAWNKGDSILLDFDHIGLFATMFFNASIGWFVMKYDPAEVEARIETRNLSQLGQDTYHHSFANAIAIKSHPDVQAALSTYADDE